MIDFLGGEVHIGPVSVDMGADVLPELPMGVGNLACLFHLDCLRVENRKIRVEEADQALEVKVLYDIEVELLPLQLGPVYLCYLLLGESLVAVSSTQDLMALSQFDNESFIFIDDGPVQRELELLLLELAVLRGVSELIHEVGSSALCHMSG